MKVNKLAYGEYREKFRAEESTVRDYPLFEMEMEEPKVKAEFIQNVRVKRRKQSGS